MNYLKRSGNVTNKNHVMLWDANIARY